MYDGSNPNRNMTTRQTIFDWTSNMVRRQPRPPISLKIKLEYVVLEQLPVVSQLQKEIQTVSADKK
jgi:hypothetical protein